METEQITEPKVDRQTVAPNPIALRNGSIAPRDASELSRTVNMVAKGGGFPDCFDTTEKRMAAYNLSNGLVGAKDWQLALNHMAFIKGKLAIYGELPGTLAQRTGEVKSKDLFLITRDYSLICVENKNLDAEVWGAICHLHRKGHKKALEFFYTLDEAKKAGQYPAKKRDGSPNPDSPWEKHFKTMLLRKAQAAAVKFVFPEALISVPIAEYDFDIMPDMPGYRDVTSSELANEINSEYQDKEEKV